MLEARAVPAGTSFNRRAVLTLAGKSATGLFGLGTAVALSRLLPVESYGNFVTLWLLYNLGSAVFASGFQGSISHAIAHERSGAKAVLASAVAVLAGVGAAISLLMFAATVWGGLGLGELRGWIAYFAFLPPMLLVKEAVEQYLVAMHRNAAASGLALLFAALKFTALAGLCWLTADVAAAHLGYSILAALALTLALGATGVWPQIAAGFGQIDGARVRAQLAIAVPLGVSSAVGALSAQLDKWMVGARLGPEHLAWYANGAIEIPLVPVVLGTVVAVGLPEFAHLHREGNTEQMAKLWRRITETLALAMIPAFVFLFAEAEGVVVLLFSEKYLPSAAIMRIFSVLLLLRVANYGMVYTAIGRPGKVLAGAVLVLAVNVLLNLALIPVYGAAGAAAATVGATFCLAAWYSLGLRAVLGLSAARLYPWGRVAKALAVCGLAIAAVNAWPLHVAWAALLYTALVAAGYWGLGFHAAIGWGGKAEAR